MSYIVFGIYVVFSLTSCAQFPVKNPTMATQPAHHIILCSILDFEKVLRTYGGSRCIFLPDGTYISGNAKKLAYIRTDMSTKWEKQINTHHQLNLSQDEKQILVMSSSIHTYQKKKVRFDTFQVYDFDGNLVKELDTFNIWRELQKISNNKSVFLIGKAMRIHVPEDVSVEFSHANSFYEIGENALEKGNPAFAKGNYIVNFNGLNFVAILSHDLKRILWSTPQISAKNWVPNWHDVKLQKNGWLLLYNNNSSLENNKPASSLDEVHPLTGERRTLYPTHPAHHFYGEVCGGVQKLSNGNILFSEYRKVGRAYEVTPQGVQVWTIDSPYLDPKTKQPEGFQEIRRQDLSSFLEKNKGL